MVTTCSPGPDPTPAAAAPAAASLLLSGDARFELPLVAPVLFVPGIVVVVVVFDEVPAVLVLGAKKLVNDRCCAPGMVESYRGRGSKFAKSVGRRVSVTLPSVSEFAVSSVSR